MKLIEKKINIEKQEKELRELKAKETKIINLLVEICAENNCGMPEAIEILKDRTEKKISEVIGVNSILGGWHE